MPKFLAAKEYTHHILFLAVSTDSEEPSDILGATMKTFLRGRVSDTSWSSSKLSKEFMMLIGERTELEWLQS